ncbi:MAG: STAS domain-containing protein [Methylobacter sp.]
MADQTIENKPNRVVIGDEVTIYTVLTMKDTLLSALETAEELELDMSGIAEIDGAGLQLVVMVKQAAAERGKVLRFTGHSPVVLELLDLSGLAVFFGDPLLMVRPSL